MKHAVREKTSREDVVSLVGNTPVFVLMAVRPRLNSEEGCKSMKGRLNSFRTDAGTRDTKNLVTQVIELKGEKGTPNQYGW